MDAKDSPQLSWSPRDLVPTGAKDSHTDLHSYSRLQNRLPLQHAARFSPRHSWQPPYQTKLSVKQGWYLWLYQVAIS